MNCDTFMSMLAQQHAENLKADPHHRFGQTFFNWLHECNPRAANQIRGTQMDPFYRDFVSTEIIMHVVSIWDNP